MTGCAFEHGQSSAGDGDPGPDAAPAPVERMCHFPDPSLRLCLEFDDGALTPTLHDSSPNRLDPSAAGLVQIIRDTIDPAATTTAATIAISETSVLDIANAITIEMWVRPDRYGSATLVGNTEQYAMILSQYGQIGCSMAERQVFSYTRSLPLHEWSHVACTYDGSRLRAYINGSNTDSVTTTSKISIEGDKGTKIVPNFDGGIDAIRVYAADLGSQLCTHAGRTGC